MSQMKEELLQKIDDHSLVIGVVGLGYVGLPLAVQCADARFKTIGFDTQEEKAALVNAGRNYIGDVEDERLAQLVDAGTLSATTDFARIAEADFIAICVPTPLDEHQQPDTSFIESAGAAVAAHLQPNTMVVLESTTYPGTTEELLKPILEKGSGLTCGTDFYLGFSPERVDPGNPVFKTKNTPKVVGAMGTDALDCIAAVYGSALEGSIARVSSPAVAEMEKILENIYRNVNIGLINEMAMLCDRMGISIWEVVDAAKTKPYGFNAFYPGPGLGGHCIPLDPYYLSWKAREYGFHTSMIESSMMVNDRMPEYCVDRAARMLNEQGKALKGSNVLILGVAYKQDIDDCRESPALRVMDILEQRGANVAYHDPFVPQCQRKGSTKEGIPELTPELIRSYDLVMITTAHSCVDYHLVQENAVAIFDTKNAMKNVKDRHNIETL